MNKSSPNIRLSKVLEAPLPLAVPSLPLAFEDLRISVDRFCLLAGVEALGEMLAEDAEALCGPRHARSAERRAHRWGTADSALAWKGGKIKVTRPRVRDLSGKEMKLASWQVLSDPDLPRAWAMNLMVLNVSTRKYGRTVRRSWPTTATPTAMRSPAWPRSITG